MASKEIQRHNQTVLDSLEPGDMVEFPRGAYSHWGVYVGDGQIIHLSGDENDGINANMDSGTLFFTICGRRFSKAFVCQEDFWNILLGCKAKKNNEKDRKLKPLRASQIVRKARDMIGEVGYNVLFNNCEHFAALCRYGEKWSEQADSALVGMTVAGAVAMGAAFLWSLFGGDKEENKKETK